MKWRKRLISILVAVLMVIIVYGNSSFASCLDVRDYGYHRYCEKTYVIREYRILTNSVDCYLKGYPVTYKFYAIYQDQVRECICGAGIQVNQVRVADDGPYIEYR